MKLCNEAVGTEKGTYWKLPQTRFLEKYMDRFQWAVGPRVEWKPMQTTYKPFWDKFGKAAIANRAEHIKVMRAEYIRNNQKS